MNSMMQVTPGLSSVRATFLPPIFTLVRLLLTSIFLLAPLTANSMSRPPSPTLSSTASTFGISILSRPLALASAASSSSDSGSAGRPYLVFS